MKFGDLTIKHVWYNEEDDVIEADFGDTSYDPGHFAEKPCKVRIRTCLNFDNKFTDNDYGAYEYGKNLVMWDTTWQYLLNSATSMCKEDSLYRRFRWQIRFIWWRIIEFFTEDS